ncbi:unnamed protein product [Soboliphyme baturini]|uniref:TNase-like domain-containing protein n=1 Tax=Soboliphyme baturini TaxID=241478 RepID=A0A3P7Z460_9BILA|nr:unnamed protein product [Soboliphyme baturini]
MRILNILLSSHAQQGIGVIFLNHHFKNAADIPEEFFVKNVRLRGSVKDVTPGGRLIVDHFPILRFFTKSKNISNIKIGLAGVNITDIGEDWLRKTLLNRPVWFTLLERSKDDVALCEVLSKRKLFYGLQYSVNRELVRKGYGKVLPVSDNEHWSAVQKVPRYSRLMQELLISEQYADLRGVGVWEREKAVERIASYPSQLRAIVVNSNFASLLVLLYGMETVGLTNEQERWCGCVHLRLLRRTMTVK